MSSILPDVKQAQKAKRQEELNALLARGAQKAEEEAQRKSLADRLTRVRNRGGTVLGGIKKQPTNLLGADTGI